MENDQEFNKEFLNPHSMLTPGFAGGMTMGITNTMATQFEFFDPWRAVVALIISCLFGLLAVMVKAMPYGQRLIYGVLNSLIIFTVAVGSNTLGRVTDDSSLASASPYAAYAQASSKDTPSGWCCLNGRINVAPREECDRWRGQFFSTQQEAQRSCQATPPDRREKERRFFQPWFKK